MIRSFELEHVPGYGYIYYFYRDKVGVLAAKKFLREGIPEEPPGVMYGKLKNELGLSFTTLSGEGSKTEHKNNLIAQVDARNEAAKQKLKEQEANKGRVLSREEVAELLRKRKEMWEQESKSKQANSNWYKQAKIFVRSIKNKE